ncbi:hypothetical protein BDP55DRAFT_673108 [Colletotrichum godetiae]|uniref:Uncharacterized protein n=1 Tax=Colletotrichum godetiae TaxID=1209918 RepID=A0AAJ0AHA6_9PEZI|nr:uncharacterized protein BDP55DRAFT_673108 [Colletotrichum godetiae]KAK1672433.1 hypothetical protein BDP55DRAFT_673108 [Colletotrichum godetiae]
MRIGSRGHAAWIRSCTCPSSKGWRAVLSSSRQSRGNSRIPVSACREVGIQPMTRPYIGKGAASCPCPNLPVSYSPKL